GESIQFPAAEVALGDGLFVLVHASDPYRATIESELGRAVSVAIVLHDHNFDAMRAGQALDLDLGAYVPGARALIYAAEDEQALVAMLQSTGAVAVDAPIHDPDDVLGGEHVSRVTPASAARRQTRTHPLDHFPLAIAVLSAAACFYGAVERRHDPVLYGLGVVLLLVAAWMRFTTTRRR
ncbi:MAG: hypothetical protein H6721_33880, partial [Sandaracinus sp.]|nr:hypothetical protein [Sandaracinus sp.]